MQDFTRPSGRLRKLPLAARVVYSVFLLFTLAALGMTGWLAQDMLGVDLAELRSYYGGGSEHAGHTPPAADARAAGGPALELPEGADVHVAEPMPLRKLLEVTHFHLFSMPVYLMILSHLFMLSGWRDRSKLLWISLASLSVAAHMAAPWLVRAQRGIGPVVYGASGSLMTLSFVIMAVVPFWEMWQPQRLAPRAD
jgi:hypothetical protein